MEPVHNSKGSLFCLGSSTTCRNSVGMLRPLKKSMQSMYTAYSTPTNVQAKYNAKCKFQKDPLLGFATKKQKEHVDSFISKLALTATKREIWAHKVQLLKTQCWGDKLLARSYVAPKTSVAKKPRKQVKPLVKVNPVSEALDNELEQKDTVPELIKRPANNVLPKIIVNSPEGREELMKCFNDDTSPISATSAFITEAKEESPTHKDETESSPKAASSKFASGRTSHIRISIYGSEKSLDTAKILSQAPSKPRKQVYKANARWQRGEIEEGLFITKYNKKTICDKTIQEYILSDELKTVVDKCFQLRVILERGVKIKIADVIKRIPESCRVSLNKKIEDLCAYLYSTAKMLLQELNNKQAEIGITDISKLFEADRTIINESKAFFENIETLDATFEYFRQCVDAFKIIIKREDRKPFPLREAQKLVYYVEKCRFLENNVEEEYRLYEASIDNNNQLSRRKNYLEMLLKNKLHEQKMNSEKNVFERLFTGYSKDEIDEEKADDNAIELDPVNNNEPSYKPREGNPKKEDITKMFHEISEEERLNEYIQSCLHKILPNKVYFTLSASNSIHRTGKSYLNGVVKSRRQLREMIKVLKLCNMTEDPALRANVNTLLKKLQKDYDYAKTKEEDTIKYKEIKRPKTKLELKDVEA